jgi:hypothetical protein
VTGRAVKHAVFVGALGVVVGTDGIAGAEALAFEGGRQHAREALSDFDEAAEGALVSCRRGIDQDAALNRLPGR